MNIHKVPAWLLNYAKIHRNQYRPLEDLRIEQWKRLKVMIRHAYNNVTYYHKLFDRAKITPNDIKTFKDMEKLPLTDKQSIKAAYPDDMIARGYTEENYIDDHTSGSSGEPLVFVVDKKAVEMEVYMSRRVYHYGGLQWSDKFAYIAPEAGETYKYIKQKGSSKLANIMLLNMPIDRLTISPWLEMDEQVRLLGSYQPDVIVGFGSSLRAVAKKAKEVRADIKPRVCFSTAEFLPEDHRKFIEGVLHTKVHRIYGSREFGELGCECPRFTGYHLNIDSYLIEIVNDGEQANTGEMGEIIITSLYNYAMPFIRYRIGDIGCISDEVCPCGRTLPLLKEVFGRTSDMITAPNGEIIVPEYFWNPWREIKGLEQAQLVQERGDLLILRLVVSDEFNKEEALNNLEYLYKRRMGNDITIEYEFVDRIDREKSGKYRMVKSKVPVRLE